MMMTTTFLNDFENFLRGASIAIVETGDRNEWASRKLALLKDLAERVDATLDIYWFEEGWDVAWEMEELKAHYDEVLYLEKEYWQSQMEQGVLNFLTNEFDLKGKDVVVIGYSLRLVENLNQLGATITWCNYNTRLGKHIYHCDLVLNDNEWYFPWGTIAPTPVLDTTGTAHPEYNAEAMVFYG